MTDYLGVHRSQQPFKPTCGMGKAVNEYEPLKTSSDYAVQDLHT